MKYIPCTGIIVLFTISILSFHYSKAMNDGKNKDTELRIIQREHKLYYITSALERTFAQGGGNRRLYYSRNSGTTYIYLSKSYNDNFERYLNPQWESNKKNDHKTAVLFRWVDSKKTYNFEELSLRAQDLESITGAYLKDDEDGQDDNKDSAQDVEYVKKINFLKEPILNSLKEIKEIIIRLDKNVAEEFNEYDEDYDKYRYEVKKWIGIMFGMIIGGASIGYVYYSRHFNVNPLIFRGGCLVFTGGLAWSGYKLLANLRNSWKLESGIKLCKESMTTNRNLVLESIGRLKNVFEIEESDEEGDEQD